MAGERKIQQLGDMVFRMTMGAYVLTLTNEDGKWILTTVCGRTPWSSERQSFDSLAQLEEARCGWTGITMIARYAALAA